MDYVTQYYKNLSEQLQQRVNILTRKVKYLTEDGPGITDGNQGSGNVTATPIAGGGYVSPAGVPGGVNPTINPYTPPDFSWQKVPWNPNLPQNPSPPQTEEEWEQQNPMPKRSDYDLDGDGILNAEELNQFYRDYEQWAEMFKKVKDNYERWMKEVRDRNRQLPGILQRDPALPYYGA